MRKKLPSSRNRDDTAFEFLLPNATALGCVATSPGFSQRFHFSPLSSETPLCVRNAPSASIVRRSLLKILLPYTKLATPLSVKLKTRREVETPPLNLGVATPTT